MNIQELATVVREKLPVKVAILNNGYLGMVRQWQEMFYGRRYSSTTGRSSISLALSMAGPTSSGDSTRMATQPMASAHLT